MRNESAKELRDSFVLDVQGEITNLVKKFFSFLQEERIKKVIKVFKVAAQE